jgi:hypothetical protein
VGAVLVGELAIKNPQPVAGSSNYLAAEGGKQQLTLAIYKNRRCIASKKTRR